MPGRQFVIADLHFGDSKLCGRADGKGRPFASATIMEREIFARWNGVVANDDIVFVLGDVGRGRHCEAVQQLRGQKHLIAGNGDDVARLAATGIFASISVARWLPGLLLTHIPVHPSQLRTGAVNVHGHLHAHVIPDARYRCVSVEQTGYRPVPLDELRATAAHKPIF